MDRTKINGKSLGLDEFLDEWFSPSPVVEAFTSGSTGEPKRILLRKSDMIISARNTCVGFDLTDTSRLGLPLSVSYIAGKMMIVRALVAGADLYIEPPSSSPFMDYIGPSFDLVAVVPAQIDYLIKSGRISQIRHLIIGGAPLSAHDERLVLASGVDAYATYGMTETCSNVALRRLGTELYVANEGIRFTSDERGCLVIKSDDMSFCRLATNDLVELVSESEFRWLGRFDNVINTGGIKVFPEKIERKLSSVLPEGAYYITSRPSKKWGTEVVGVYLVDLILPDKLHAADELLLPYEKPKLWIAVRKFDYTSNGKLIRRKY